MKASELFLPHFDVEMQSTRRVLERVPEDKFGWKPHAKSTSLGQLSGHVAHLPTFLATMITTDEVEFDPSSFKPVIPASRAQLLEEFEKNAATARKTITGASEEHLAKKWALKMNGREVWGGPRTLLLPMTLAHLVHHRAQLTVYLRLNDVPVPGVYGPSADEALPAA